MPEPKQLRERVSYHYVIPYEQLQQSNLDMRRVRQERSDHYLGREVMAVLRASKTPVVVELVHEEHEDFGVTMHYGPGRVLECVDHLRFTPTVVRHVEFVSLIDEPLKPPRRKKKPSPQPTWWQRLKNGVADAWKDAEQLSGCGITKPEA